MKFDDGAAGRIMGAKLLNVQKMIDSHVAYLVAVKGYLRLYNTSKKVGPSRLYYDIGFLFQRSCNQVP